MRKAAKLVGFDAAYLSRIEAGKVAPSDELVGRLANVLACEKEELFVVAGRLPDTLRPAVDKQTHSVVAAIRDTLNAALDHAAHAVVPPRPTCGQPLAIDDGFPFEAVALQNSGDRFAEPGIRGRGGRVVPLEMEVDDQVGLLVGEVAPEGNEPRHAAPPASSRTLAAMRDGVRPTSSRS